MAKTECLILSHLKSTDFFFSLSQPGRDIIIYSAVQVKNLRVISKFILYLSLATSALQMSFIDHISNILTPFICGHFHFYLPGPINCDFHLTYCISPLLVSFFCLVGWSTVFLFFDILFSSVPQQT